MDYTKKQIYVFCDFDGTITLKDVGDELFIKYGSFEPYHSQLLNKEIDIRKYWLLLCNSLPENFSNDIINDYASSIEIDAYFIQFVQFCKVHHINIKIVSDGFSNYIQPILEREGLDFIEFSSNYLEFSKGVKPIFPGASESCSCFSASCKRNSVLKNISDDDFVVYIGDGYSDFCPAEYSDIIFAKKNLARYCNDMKIPHYNYSSFFDIIRIFKDIILKKNKLKHRRQAQLKRMEAYYIE